jgi:hypothetical protein
MANYVDLKILIDNEEITPKCNEHEMKRLPLSFARRFVNDSLINLKLKLNGSL